MNLTRFEWFEMWNDIKTIEIISHNRLPIEKVDIELQKIAINRIKSKIEKIVEQME